MKKERRKGANKMKGAVETIEGDFEVKEVDSPKPHSNEIFIGVKASGICCSDLRGGRSE